MTPMMRWLVAALGSVSAVATAGEPCDGTRLGILELHVPAALELATVEQPDFAWAAVVVNFELGPDGAVESAWSELPDTYRAERARIVPAPDARLSPSQVRQLQEAAEQAVRGSRFVVRGQGEATTAKVRFVWRNPFEGVDLSRLATSFRRTASVVVADDSPLPLVVLLRGPTERHDAVFPDTPTEEDALAARGVPTHLDSDACRLLTEPPELEEPGKPPPLIPGTRSHPPSYPDEARVLRFGGEVRLRVLLDETGRVEGAYVERGVPGFPSFAQAAVEAVCHQRYEPTVRDGVPVPVAFRFKSVFGLK